MLVEDKKDIIKVSQDCNHMKTIVTMIISFLFYYDCVCAYTKQIVLLYSLFYALIYQKINW